MTHTELEEIRKSASECQDAEWASCLVSELIAEVERLRGLIKNAEYTDVGYWASFDACNWCSHESPGHDIDCPAFTPEGEVK